MAEYSMHLRQISFQEISSGTKTLELRVNDAKRKGVCIGDTILFTKLEQVTETVRVKVIDRKEFDSWQAVALAYAPERWGSRFTSSEQLVAAGHCYSQEEVEQYGFVVFEIEKLAF